MRAHVEPAGIFSLNAVVACSCVEFGVHIVLVVPFYFHP